MGRRSGKTGTTPQTRPKGLDLLRNTPYNHLGMQFVHISPQGRKPLTRRRNLSQKIFGEWFVTNKWRPTGKDVEWLCRCSCGQERWVRADNLQQGRTKSCGLGHEFTGREDNAVAS